MVSLSKTPFKVLELGKRPDMTGKIVDCVIKHQLNKQNQFVRVSDKHMTHNSIIIPLYSHFYITIFNKLNQNNKQTVVRSHADKVNNYFVKKILWGIIYKIY